MADDKLDLDDQPLADALAWHRLIDTDLVDWDEFTRWLEGLEAHRRAYDAVSLIEADLTDWRARKADERQDVPVGIRRSPRRWWLAGAAAAALAAVGMPSVQWMRTTPAATYDAGSDRQLAVALPDGSRVLLAPGSRLVIDGQGMASVRGAAWFNIRHDPSRQITVQANGWRITDIGTQFEVKTVEADGLWVGVAEGSLRVGQDRKPTVELLAGQAAFRSNGRLERFTVAPSTMAKWRTGTLVYDDAPIVVVAADLGRYAGKRIVPGPGLRGLRFTGSLSARAGDASVREFAAILGARVVEDDTSFTLVAGGA